MARKAKGRGQSGKPCALLVATLVAALSGCGPQECHSTLLEVQHTAAGVPSPAIAPGATTELHLLGLRRLGCDGSLSASAYFPLRVTSEAPATLEVVEQRPGRLVVRGHAAGAATLVLEGHGERARFSVVVAPAVRAEILSPLAGATTAAPVLLLVGADVRLPVRARDAQGRDVVGDRAIEATRAEGAVTLFPGTEADLHLRAERAGEGRIALLGTSIRTESVEPSAVAAIDLDLQADDTSIGYGCIPPAPRFDQPVSHLHTGERPFLFVRLRASDGRAIAGIVEAPRSATPEVCTVAPAKAPERAREVLEFHLPHARDYQRSAWELRAVARGTCRVEARVGEIVAQTLVEVD
ncbi:hypothetical protein [Polyangium mundeleinium]|uniref:Lipoprotein n=1 Tax=Polyangium mundeleinium TaxID=2995306 RepID=A0ABT5EVG2_9BACT|nr:hypothetical protein [Polyangium mundeleinium]MDC0744775.1 hypothetical protein [Polyangium mundeleinium]